MSMNIQHNMSAMNAHRNMGVAATKNGKAMEKLSTGFRINRAADDAAGLAISEKMRSQIRGLSQASRNANDGISLIQTAEGALSTTHEALQRMQTLSTQAASGTYTVADKKKAQDEVNNLMSEIDRIADTTEFNTMKLLNGDLHDGKGGLVTTSAASGTVLNATKAVFDTRKGDYAPMVGNNAAATLINREMTASATYTTKSSMKTVTVMSTTAGVIKTPATYTNVPGGPMTASATYSMTTTTGTVKLTETDRIANQLTTAVLSGAKASMKIGDKAFTLDLTQTKSFDDLKTLVNSKRGSGAQGLFADEVITKLETVVNEALEKAGAGIKIDLSIDGKGQLNMNSTDGKTKLTLQNSDIFEALGLKAGTTETTPAAKAYADQAVTVSKGLTLSINGKDQVVDLTSVSNIQAGDDVTKFINSVKTAITGAIGSAMATQNLQTGDEGFIDTSQMDVQVDAKSGKMAVFFAEKQLDVKMSGSFADQFGLSGSMNTIGSADYPGKGMTLHIGANENQVINFGISDMHSDALGLKGIDLTNGVSAEKALTTVQNAINKVSDQRSSLGAVQNRLEYTITNLDTTSENLQSSEARVRDADMASEVMSQTQSNVLQQAAQAMLAQANQKPQSVLQLLG